MNLEELTRRFRALAGDKVAPYLFDSKDVADWLTDAEAQAAVRGRLLLDDVTPAVCQVAVTAGRGTYKLHSKLYELADVRFRAAGGTESVALKLATREWLDANVWEWRDATDWHYGGRYAVQTEMGLRLVPAPDVDGTLLIEGYRLPLKAMEEDYQKPEIHEASHVHLIQWALHRAFSVPDSETFDPQRSANAQAAFERVFGPPVDSDMRRSTRADEVQCNTSYPP